jgi:hypothetical protein
MRVVADPAALDNARWHGEVVTVLRTAPDEVIGIGATGTEVDDEHAIVVDEPGLVGGSVDLAVIQRHTEWPLPTERPALAQGSIAGIPAKLWLTEGGALLVAHAAYAADLEARLR